MPSRSIHPGVQDVFYVFMFCMYIIKAILAGLFFFFFHFPNMQVCSRTKGPRPPAHPPMRMSSSFSTITFPPLVAHTAPGYLHSPLLRVRAPFQPTLSWPLALILRNLPRYMETKLLILTNMHKRLTVLGESIHRGPSENRKYRLWLP